MNPFDIKERKKEYNKKHREKKKKEKDKEIKEVTSDDTIIDHHIYQPKVKFIDIDVSDECVMNDVIESKTEHDIQPQEEEEREEEEEEENPEYDSTVEEIGEVFRLTEDEFNAFIEKKIKERTAQEKQTLNTESLIPTPALPESFFFQMMRHAGTMAMSQITNLMVVSAVGMTINMIANTTNGQPFTISQKPTIPLPKENIAVKSQQQNNTLQPPPMQLNVPVGNLF